ncbi:SCO7613 C-terminal domain-containing membrane protein [Trujillonella humicola]|uniref:SCO7613 C-terminal domain-containing membrane protein n=1 Tax=Trujillonella humicola TaxID=3383699 RepID=UPI0039064286
MPTSDAPPWLASPAWDRPTGQAAPAPARRLSPQQVLLGLGALLLVAGALAFVAVAWNRLGVTGQAVVLLAVTASLCAASARTARRGLRATEEALAAAGAALLAVDLGAAHALGLGGVDDVPLRLWTAWSCAVVALVALALGRLTRSTAAWPLIALLAAQPVPLLLLPGSALSGPAGVAALLGLALGDVLALTAVRALLRPVARLLTGAAAAGAALLGIAVAWERAPLPAWTATGLLLAATAGALLLTRARRSAAVLPGAVPLAAAGAVASAAATTGAMDALGPGGLVVATALGLALLCAAVLLARSPVARAGTAAGGAVLALAGAGALLDDDRFAALAPLALAAAVPAVLAAVRLPQLRPAAVGAALAAPAGAVLLAAADGPLGRPAAGLLLALVAAAAFAVASLRAGHPEEQVAAAVGAVAGLLAVGTTAPTGALGQVAVQLAVLGAAAGGYGLAVRSRVVQAVAVAVLVGACWTAVAGVQVAVVEAYTLPAAAGLLVLALPGLRAGGRSWAAEGSAVAVALVPSALAAVAEPSPVRWVLVVVAAAAATAAGALAHRQAPFVLGAASLAWVVLGRLAPYAPLLPRWITLGAVGLVLLVVGATYERRRQQAREAVVWVTQMR